MPEVVVRLVTADRALLDAALGDRTALADALDCDVAEGWDVFPGALRRKRDEVSADPHSTLWGARLFVVQEPRTLVGWGGFKGPPRDGVIEVGYAVAPSWQGRGVATAAVREMLREAFAVPTVQTVTAHTRAEPGPSVRVLEKVGFVRDGEAPDEAVGTAWRFRLDRETVLHVEMTAVEQLRPARPVRGLELVPIHDPGGSDLALLRSVHDRLAAAHLWSSLAWTEQQWRSWVSDAAVRHWWIRAGDDVIGWGCLRAHPGDEMEIDSFGIVPEAIGHGFGGYALTLLAQIAWHSTPSVRRVWLHTSTWDHPHALANYRARGFVRPSGSGPDADDDSNKR